MTIYSAKCHQLTLTQCILFELRNQAAAGFILDEVDEEVAAAIAQKRSKFFDYKKTINKLSRLSKPKMGHAQPTLGTAGFRPKTRPTLKTQWYKGPPAQPFFPRQ